jgi:hypothetical protein
MELNEIILESMDKSFEYERQSRIIDSLNSDELKKMSKLYLKLYLRQQEVLCMINTNPL